MDAIKTGTSGYMEWVGYCLLSYFLTRLYPFYLGERGRGEEGWVSERRGVNATLVSTSCTGYVECVG